MTPPIQAPESFVEIHFPSAGIDLSQAFMQQPNRPVLQGIYARTTPAGNNVRGYEAITQRVRGGSRPGLSKYIPVAPVTGWILQLLDVIVLTDDAVIFQPPSGVPIAPP